MLAVTLVTIAGCHTLSNMWTSSSVTMHATVASLPAIADLSLSSPDIVFSNSSPSEGQCVTISATVHNDGGASAENVTTQFYDSGTLIDEGHISFISHNSQTVISTEWTAAGEGFHLFKVVVDPYNAIDETDEENNEATRSLLVGEFPYFGGIVLNGSLDPSETLTGHIVTVQGYAEYNTTYGAGEPVAGAQITITITGWRQETTHTISNGTYRINITAPYTPESYSVTVTISDCTFSESIELGLVVTQEHGIDLALFYYDIVFLPCDPIENDSVNIFATIHNVGTENASNVLVSFHDDSKNIGSQTIELISAGECAETALFWNASRWGWHTIKVMADPDGAIPELDESNNEASKNLYVYPLLPDLTPTGIGFSDWTPLVNQTITISANVKNIGGTEASNVLVSFYDNGQSIANATIALILGKGDSRIVSVPYAFTVEGWHLIDVIVGVDNQIGEADENNNWYCIRIYVHLPLPDLTLSPSDITFSNNAPELGDMITIHVTTYNVGEVDAENVTIEVFDNDAIITPPVTVPRVDASGQEAISVSWNATPAGWHQIKVVVDGNDTIAESAENNNEASKYIHVSPQLASDPCIYSEDIVFSNTCPIEGEGVTIYATVHNVGEAEAQDVTVTFYVDDVQLGTLKTIASIPVGGEATVTAHWVAAQVGSHVAKVRIDTAVEKSKVNNVATRALIVGKHDVALVELVKFKTVVCQGYLLRVRLTVANEGNYGEIVNVTVYVSPFITQSAIVTVGSNMSNVLLFQWIATDFQKGNYTISAYVWPVFAETDVADNRLTNGWVVISMVGDVTGLNGWPDGKVDMLDVGSVARRFQTGPGDPLWNPNFDINDDGVINMIDIGTVARHFGEVDP